MKSPDFTFNVGVPVFFVTEQDKEKLGPLEPHMQVLVDAGHMTESEAYSYLTFSGLATGIPFLMQEFLTEYRNAEVRKAAEAEEERKAEASAKFARKLGIK